MRRGAGVARRLLHAGHVGRDLVGADRGLLHVARNLLRRRALLFDRGGNRRGDFVDFADGRGDRTDGADRVGGRALDRGDLRADLLGRLAVCSARFFTSEATTANPRPASPARAASIVAFSASRLVWLAISLISLTTSPIRVASADRSCTVAFVRSASATALRATLADCATCRLISVIELVELFGRCRDSLHVGRSFFGRGGDRGRLTVGLFRRRCHRRRRRLQLVDAEATDFSTIVTS